MAPTSTNLDVNGLTFRVVQDGDPTGPAVLLLHGFPDGADLWRYQIPVLAGAGYRVIAPDLRGFGGSSKPTKTTDYALPLLGADVLGILCKLEIERFHLVAHDFGAVLAWLFAAFMSLRLSASEAEALARMQPAVATILQAAQVKPQIQSLTALSVGHPRAYKQASIAQREKSWYILFFQFERAEGALAAHDYQLLRDWSQTQNSPFTEAAAEVDRWITHFQSDSPANLRAALNWYRANTNPDRSVADRDDIPLIGVRTLGVWGEGDPHQTEAPMKRSGDFVDPKAGFRYETIAGGGHWLQLERAAAFNGLLLEWLGK